MTSEVREKKLKMDQIQLLVIVWPYPQNLKLQQTKILLQKCFSISALQERIFSGMHRTQLSTTYEKQLNAKRTKCLFELLSPKSSLKLN